ncbi:MAG: glycoside hydrolase family 88 protein [Tannerella sp.]|jgi:predicted alpha-1,6-mannanase (GH76 family)|nr:glycoside hydrolase family 88 protein [Tannerella sp.]
MKRNFFLLPLCLLLFACGESEDNPDPNGNGDDTAIDWNSAADKSSQALIRSFWNAGDNYFNYDSNGKADFHYWPQAHALDVLVDAWLRTGDNTYRNYFDRWFEGVRIRNGNTFRNDYYDDMEWNALAMLRAWKATNDEKYKEAALQIWEYIKAGWNDNAGGGITWKKGMEYSKNACSNGPACILAARLYQEFGDEKNREWAFRIYNWEKTTLFNSNNGTVYDNINSETGEIQKNWVFTYNQGTFIGSAIELHQISGERSYLNDAVLAADHATGSLVSSSILKSEGTGDGGLFKGIFIRYFTVLIQQERLDAAVKKRYVQFLKYNAETLWNDGTSQPSVFYGPDWRTSPSSSTGLTEQLSGCMLIEAAALLRNKEIM